MNRPILIILGLLLVAAAPLGAQEDAGLKLLRSGLDRLQRGDYEGALLKFRDAQIERPESAELHFNVGVALYRLERFEEAATAFETAARGSDAEVEKKSHLHLGNCLVKQGKYEEAVTAYNKAIALDEGYEAARVNREWVVRKMKELARKQKAQQEKQKEERKVIEKLQELIQRQTGSHLLTRAALRDRGAEIARSKLLELRAVLDAETPDELRSKLAQTSEEQLLSGLASEQEKILEDFRALLVEVGQMVENAGADPNFGAAPPQAADQAEVEKLKKALPHLEGAEPLLERAHAAVSDDGDLVAANVAQEEALRLMLLGLDELLDPLSRLIKEQAALLTRGFELARSLEAEDGAARPGPERLRDLCIEDANAQEDIRSRTEAFAKALQMQVEQMRQALAQQQAPGGQGTQPGQDPEEGMRRYEQALGHVNEGASHMELAELELGKPELQNGLQEERIALEELIKARAALQPPQQQGGEQQKQDQQNQDEKQNEQEGEQQQEADQQEKQDQSEGQGEEGAPDQKEGEQPPEMSEEQAKKTLERARQRELEKRREDQKEARKAARGGRAKVEKDW